MAVPSMSAAGITTGEVKVATVRTINWFRVRRKNGGVFPFITVWPCLSLVFFLFPFLSTTISFFCPFSLVHYNIDGRLERDGVLVMTSNAHADTP